MKDSKSQVIDDRRRIRSYLRIDVIEVQIRNFLQGEVLTLIDSSIENERQCKALKDSIKLAFTRKMRWLNELSGDKYADAEKAVPEKSSK